MGLFDFLNKLPTMNEITGTIGEWLAKFYATTLPGVRVLHDVLIDGEDGHTSQIDLLIIGDKGIYVVEVKMFADAKIYGDIRRPMWYSYYHGKRYEMYSPIKQNHKHVCYLKDFLREFGDVPCFSVIAMICEDFKVSGDFPENTVLCNSYPAMERGIYRIADGKPIVLDAPKKDAIFDYIQNNQHKGKDSRLEHKENVKEYRTSSADMRTQKMCPYCKTDLILRNGRYGQFYGCPNYPRCKYTLGQ